MSDKHTAKFLQGNPINTEIPCCQQTKEDIQQNTTAWIVVKLDNIEMNLSKSPKKLATTQFPMQIEATNFSLPWFTGSRKHLYYTR